MAPRFSFIVVAVLLSACVPKSELETVQKQIATLQAELSAAQTRLGEAQTNAATLHTENLRLKAELDKKPPLPVAVSFRKALSGPGYVAVLSTTIKSEVAVLATVQSNALGTSKRFELHLNPTAPHSLGHLEGAVIAPGDVITLENQNYSTVTVVASIK